LNGFFFHSSHALLFFLSLEKEEDGVFPFLFPNLEIYRQRRETALLSPPAPFFPAPLLSLSFFLLRGGEGSFPPRVRGEVWLWTFFPCVCGLQVPFFPFLFRRFTPRTKYANRHVTPPPPGPPPHSWTGPFLPPSPKKKHPDVGDVGYFFWAPPSFCFFAPFLPHKRKKGPPPPSPFLSPLPIAVPPSLFSLF